MEHNAQCGWQHPAPGAPCPRSDDCIEHVWATNNICIAPCLANLALQRGSRGVGGGLVVQAEGGGGGVKIKRASSPVLSWGPRTHHVPHRFLGNRP